MNSRFLDCLSFCSAVAIGLAISTGHPVGLTAAVGMPVACLMAKSRKSAFRNTLGYYCAGLWPMIPGSQRYLGHSSSLLMAIMLWACSAILLSVPWTFAWTASCRSHYLWRVLLANLALIVPPLGLVGFISPVAGAGYLFPGTGWIGLAATALLPGIVLALNHSTGRSRTCLRFAFSAAIALGFGAHVFISAQAKPPANWEAVNTNFGDLARPFQDFAAAQSIQNRVAASSARVLIFPESVVPRWSDATNEFWQQTLVSCRDRGQILAIGAGLSRTSTDPKDRIADYDFAGAIQALRSNDRQLQPYVQSNNDTRSEPFDNTLLILGAESATFFQRVPVPIGMWQPFSDNGVPLRLDGPGVVRIDGQLVAVLICYEQLLTYPILASMVQHPTVLVGISNMFWFADSPIPRYQASALRAWSKLFRIPYLLAVNY
jgi:apolipoprotein N-acyltransferase